MSVGTTTTGATATSTTEPAASPPGSGTDPAAVHDEVIAP